MLFERVSVIGMGLIGSSLVRAIKEHKIAGHITAIDISEDVCQQVTGLGIADEITTSISDGVAESDLVIIAVPVGVSGDVAACLTDYLKPGSIVTDVGSVKENVIAAVSPHIPKHACFIPAHPIAGTENSGPTAGFSELFKGRWCIVTPYGETEERPLEKIVKLWEACGSRVEIMDPKRHDLVLAITSHLPHLIAYTIVGTATELEEDTKEDVIEYSAGGFRDFTRIAASNPIMWRDIFLNNKDAVLDILQRFNEDLTGLQKAIRRGDGDTLEQFFTRTRSIRREIVESGQALGPTKANECEVDLPPLQDQEKVSGSAI